jgi:hypothetical protein
MYTAGKSQAMIYRSVSQPTGRDPATGRGGFQMGRGRDYYIFFC